MFTPQEEKQIKGLNQQLSQDITFTLVSPEGTPGSQFQEFCYELIRLAPRIKITREAAAPLESPQIRLVPGLRYQAVPAGYELQPFLDALAAVHSGSLKMAESVKERIKKNKLPANLTVFIAPQCAFCPQVVRQLVTLPLTDDKLQLTIIDGSLFPDALQAHRVRAVPTILLEEEFRWTGSVPLEEIVDAITTRDPASLGSASLENLLKDGGAGRLAEMMLDSKKIFPAFYDVLTHNKWPTRLGAMVVMEEITEKNQNLASEALNPLWSRFKQVSAQVQGDILHVFGEIGDPRVLSWLKAVLAGQFDPEVKEAAEDAITKLSEPNKSGCGGS